MTGPDSGTVAHLLAALGAADPQVCGLATDLLGSGIHWRSGDEGLTDLSDEPTGGPSRRDLREPVTDPGALAALGPALRADRPCVRRAAAQLLGGSGRPAALALLRTALSQGDNRTRQAAILGLGLAADSSDASRLRPLLGDPDPAVARLASWALGRLQDSGATARLVLLLRHRDAGVRRAAAWALGQTR
jgi:HEAT repeat protein